MPTRKSVSAPKPMVLAPEFRAKHAIPEGANAKQVINALLQDRLKNRWGGVYSHHSPSDVRIEGPSRGQWTHYHAPGSQSVLVVSKSRGDRPVTTKYLGIRNSVSFLNDDFGLLMDARRNGLPVPKPLGTGFDNKKGPFVTMEYAGVQLADLLRMRQKPENMQQIMRGVLRLVKTFAEQGLDPIDFKPLVHICINPQTGRAQLIDMQALHAGKPSVVRQMLLLALKENLRGEPGLNAENKRIALEMINKELRGQ